MCNHDNTMHFSNQPLQSGSYNLKYLETFIQGNSAGLSDNNISRGVDRYLKCFLSVRMKSCNVLNSHFSHLQVPFQKDVWHRAASQAPHIGNIAKYNSEDWAFQSDLLFGFLSTLMQKPILLIFAPVCQKFPHCYARQCSFDCFASC